MTTICPPDMNWVMPYIIVEDAAQAAEFYRDVFGFEITLEMPNDEGTIVHIEMRHQDSVMMCGSVKAQGNPDTELKTPKEGGFKPPMSLFAYIAD